MTETVTIDGVDYVLADLSPDARSQLNMLLACERKMNDLRAELAIIQTARQSYAKALNAALPKPTLPGFSAGTA